jgi:hypothetical protein
LALGINATITSLHLRYCQLTDSVLAQLCPGLFLNTIVATLDFAYNLLTDRGADSLAAVLASSTTLQTLDLSHNKIGYRGFQAILLALGRNATLQELDVSHNCIYHVADRAAANAVAKNRGLRSLNLADNRDLDFDAALAQILLVNQCLTNINLANTPGNAWRVFGLNMAMARRHAVAPHVRIDLSHKEVTQMMPPDLSSTLDVVCL